MEELVERLRELAEGLARAHFGGPPVDPFLLAERLGIAVLRRGAVARWLVREGRTVVHLPAALPPERARFVLAHEIVEIVAAHPELSGEASPPLPWTRELAPRAERLFQLGAGDLLMPRRWFTEAAARCGWDLASLRERFEVSWEAATRRVPICTPAVGTVVDNGRVSCRVGSEGLAFPRRPSPEEREAIEAAYAAWPAPGPQAQPGPGFHCTAWPALPERNAIRRVCVVTLVEE